MSSKKVIIAHRANTEGPNHSEENSPERVDYCIKKGFDVEIDLWFDVDKKKIHLGHDAPEYEISWNWLYKRSKFIWIHCKNFSALDAICNLNVSERSQLRYFWHQEDDYTITSNQLIWAYPGKPFNYQTIIVMPEWNNPDWKALKNTICYGICTDYPKNLL